MSTGALRNTAPAVATYLGSIPASLDVHGSRTPHALTDGLMIIPCLFGFNGAIGAGATRTTSAQIETFLQSVMP